MILQKFTAGPIGTNAYLLACPDTKEAAIIDSPFESTNALLSALDELGLNLKMALFTHSHWDHIAEAFLLKKLKHVPMWIHAEDAGNLEKPGSDKVPSFFPFAGVKPDHFFKDEEIIPLGNLQILVIHTPGHTPGGCCFYLKDEGTLIAGDTLFKGGYGRLDLPTARPKLMRQSLRKLSELPQDTIVYCGHGEETTIREESWILKNQEQFL